MTHEEIKEGKVKMIINGIEVETEVKPNLLELLREQNIDIPTLCYTPDLEGYGACRLCVVEIKKGKRERVVVSCVYPVEDGLEVKTNTEKINRIRRMLIEMLLARCPASKVLNDLANKYGVKKVRFEKENDDCILCGLCVRICQQKVKADTIGFAERGTKRRVASPFDIDPDRCIKCGGCMYICPVLDVRCTGERTAECNSCNLFYPPALKWIDRTGCKPTEKKKEVAEMDNGGV